MSATSSLRNEKTVQLHLSSPAAKMHKLQVEWKIDDFEAVSRYLRARAGGNFLRTPWIRHEAAPGDKWALFLRRSDEDDSKLSVEFLLRSRQTSENQPFVAVSFSLFVRNEHGDDIAIFEHEGLDDAEYDLDVTEGDVSDADDDERDHSRSYVRLDKAQLMANLLPDGSVQLNARIEYIPGGVRTLQSTIVGQPEEVSVASVQQATDALACVQIDMEALEEQCEESQTSSEDESVGEAADLEATNQDRCVLQ